MLCLACVCREHPIWRLGLPSADNVHAAAVGSHAGQRAGEQAAAAVAILVADKKHNTCGIMRSFLMEVHEVIELVLGTESQTLASSTDLPPSVKFSSPSSTAFTAKGFWDGNRWKVRFSPDEPGLWHWVRGATSKLDQVEQGTFTVVPGTSTKPWRKHGPLALHESGRALAHTDGTPVFWLADTVWPRPRTLKQMSGRPMSRIGASRASTFCRLTFCPNGMLQAHHCANRLQESKGGRT
jgi:hypothetical protein